MKRRRFSDIPLIIKIGFPPAFALIMLGALVGSMSWSQHQQQKVLFSVLEDSAVRGRLADDTRRIAAANGALYTLMTQQAAGGAPAGSRQALANVLDEINSVKKDLVVLRPQVPPAERAGIDGSLKDLSDYAGAIEVVGSMLGVDFDTAADFIQPFQANYLRMTAALNHVSQAVAAASGQRARNSVRDAIRLDHLMIVFAMGTLLAVSLVAGGMVLAIRRSVNDISRATETLAAGQLDLDLASLERRDELGAIVRSLAVFRENQHRIAKLRDEQAAMEAHAETLKKQQEEQRETAHRQQQAVVTSLAAALDSLASGHLNDIIHEAFPEGYEKLRGDFNAAVAKLTGTMQAVSAATANMRSGTNEISQASDDLSRRTEQQAVSLAETAMAIDEITIMVRRTAEAAQQAADGVSGAKSRAEAANGIARDTITAMGEITRLSGEIGQIVGIIDEISFQTNLLALNAGIEAARVGDAGRGFAVVASEVRALSARSAVSAKKIGELIRASTRSVDAGVARVGEMSSSLQEILAQVSDVSQLVGEISRAAKEQASGLAAINGAVGRIDTVTQQNAAVAGQTATASRTLAAEADGLAGLMGHFHLKETPPEAPQPGRAGAAPPAMPRRRHGAPKLTIVDAGHQ